MAGRIKRNHSGFQTNFLSGHLQSRFLWADVIRILAIFLVLATHLSYQPQFITTGGLIYFLYFGIVKTCIPLFVMLSGALLLGKNESHSVFFKKRLGRLLLPWVFWSAVFLFIEKQYFSLIHDIPSFFRAFFWTMESFWFLPMIVCLYILTPAIRTFVANTSLKEIGYLILIWFVVVAVLPYHHNSMAFPLQVDNGLLRQVINFSGYFLLGYVLVKIKESITPVISFLIFLLGLSWTGIMTLSMNLPSQQLMYLYEYISPGNILMSVGIFSFIISLLGRFEGEKTRFQKIVISVSKASLGIYFVHAFVWPFLHQKMHFAISPFPYGLFSAVVLFVICFIFIFALQQIPYLKKLVS